MHARLGARVLAVAAAVGLAVSIIAYFDLGDGIDHTAGVVLVIVSTAILLLAALMLMFRLPAWLCGLLFTGCVLDILGTGVAAWFLHAWLLLALMALALIGWLLALLGSRSAPAGAVSSPATVS